MTLTFQPCDMQKCVNVSITDDLINEPEERFAVSLTLSDNASSLINLGSATGDIVITDDDGVLYTHQLVLFCVCFTVAIERYRLVAGCFKCQYPALASYMNN